MDLSDIRGVIWDFDGVFYAYSQTGLEPYEFFDLADELNGKAAHWALPGLDLQTAFELAVKSHDEFENPVTAFVPFIKAAQIPEETAKLYIFNRYQQLLHDKIKALKPYAFKNTAITWAFNSNGYGLEHVIVSQSSGPFWITPLLKEMGLDHHFPEDRVIGYDEYDYVAKKFGPDGVQLALARVGHLPENMLYVEDSYSNIQMAKTHFPELRCVLVKEGEVDPADYPDADLVVKSAAALLDILDDAPRGAAPSAGTFKPLAAAL